MSNGSLPTRDALDKKAGAYQPKECAEIVAGLLRAEGVTAELSNRTSALLIRVWDVSI